MIFRQLFDRDSCTYTYLLGDADTGDAVLIDPVRELVERDEQILRELGLTLRFTLETHVHADHVTGSGLLRQRLGSQSVVAEAGGAPCADVQARHGDRITFGGQSLEVRRTPGHTDGCVSYVDHANKRVFTGDTLLIRGCGRTDFQQGSPAKLYESVHEQIFSLPDDFSIFPGHDYKGRTASSVAEEKAHNARLGGGKSQAEFQVIMDNLKLAYPKKIDVAVPANLKCGLLPGDSAEDDATWAPVERVGPVPEVKPAWVAAHLGQFQVVDVRRLDEFVGELGRVPNSQLAPLPQLDAAAEGWDPSAPVVVVCRSGGRSGRAAVALEQKGFQHVASMAGGMLAWNDAALAIETGPAPDSGGNVAADQPGSAACG